MELSDKYRYCPDTGKFYSKKSIPRHKKSGDEVGFLNSNGYVMLSFEGKQVRAHRAAWLMSYGEVPDGQIDHINGEKTDNRIKNLRVVTNQENQMNKRVQSNNRGGTQGVYWDKARRKYQAHLVVDGVKKALGRYDDWHEAVYAHWYAKVDAGYHYNHGRL
mgnify:FL=1|tara:strand:+ start:73 stop:555 length:483 start_codon:yes stop_codon:yes gene_type:complete